MNLGWSSFSGKILDFWYLAGVQIEPSGELVNQTDL